VATNVKGTLVSGVVKALREDSERALPLLDPSLHRYFSEHILSTAWYPENEFWAMVDVMAQLAPPDRDAYRDLGQREARVHVETVYSALSHIAEADPPRVLSRLTHLWPLQHDTGKLVLGHVSSNELLLALVDYAIVSETACRTITGYCEGLFEWIGMKNVTVERVHCRGFGDADCDWRVRW
jgi:uncharacterized protein (TIGR02265 family)